MTEVEIVARALYEAPSDFGTAVTDNIPPPWDRLLQATKDGWYQQARAAITALDSHRASLGLVTVPEEPTMGMYDDFIAASKASNDKMFAGFEDGYRAMIQAALTTAKKREG